MTPEEVAEGRVDLINARKLLKAPGVWTKALEERNTGKMCILDAIGWAALGEDSRYGVAEVGVAPIYYDTLRSTSAVRILYASSGGDFSELEDLYTLNDRPETDLEMVLDVLDRAITFSENELCAAS